MNLIVIRVVLVVIHVDGAASAIVPDIVVLRYAFVAGSLRHISGSSHGGGSGGGGGGGGGGCVVGSCGMVVVVKESARRCIND